MDNRELLNFQHQEKPLQDQLEDWANNNPDKVRKTEIPEKFFNLLIPRRIFEITVNSNNIQILPLKNKRLREAAIMIIEKHYPEQLTDSDAWQKWQTAIAEASEKDSLVTIIPEPPTEVNRLHARFSGYLKDGTLSFSDRILMTCRLTVDANNPQILYIGDYDGETQKGIAYDFFSNALSDFAKRLGCRCTTALNNLNNIGFFVGKLGRRTYWDLKPEYRQKFFPTIDQKEPPLGIANVSTIQFLYQDDEEKYTLAKESF